MKTTIEIKDARFYPWDSGDAHKLTAQQRKMFDIAWINDQLYIHASITGIPQLQVMLCATFDGIPHCIDGNDLYVPVDWVERQYPYLREAMKHCRKKSAQVRYDK